MSGKPKNTAETSIDLILNESVWGTLSNASGYCLKAQSVNFEVARYWFSGRRPSRLPSPGRRPREKTKPIDKGPKARRFSNRFAQMVGPLTLKSTGIPLSQAFEAFDLG